MSRFLCDCFMKKTATKPKPRQVPTDRGVSLTEFEDLMKKPVEVDTNLEASVQKWERCINDYRVCETSILTNIETNTDAEFILSVIEKLRDFPEQYKGHAQEDVCKLAKFRCEIYYWQTQLGLPRDMRHAGEKSNLNPEDDADYDGVADDVKGSKESTSTNPLFASSSAAGKTALIGERASELTLEERVRMLRADPLVHRSLRSVQAFSESGKLQSSLKRSVSKDGRSSEVGSARAVLEGSRGSTSSKDAASSTLKANMIADAIADNLSATWADRLGMVDMTQGGISGANPDGSESGLSSRMVKVKPKWPQFLQDIWFDVIKWNNMGRKQRRLIKLTEYHILNIKTGNQISKLYCYVDLRRIWLENSNTLMFVMKDQEHPICYISPMAPSIVQQITTRVQVRMALEKTAFTATHVLEDALLVKPEFSKAAAVQMIEAIEADIGADTVMDDFAHGLMDRMSKNRPQSSMGSNAGASKSERAKNKKLFVFSEGSLENLVHQEVQRVIFDDKTDEGNTRRVFLESFDESKRVMPKRSLTKVRSTSEVRPQPKKSLTDVRHFIDGLHEYYLSSRGLEMTIIMLAWIKEHEHQPPVSAAGEGGSKSGGAATTRGSVSRRGSAALRNISGNTMRGSIRGIQHADELTSLDEEQLSTLSFIAFTVIEESVFLPLRDQIVQMLPSYNTSRDVDLATKMQRLRKRTQAQWGVPSEFISPLNWETASFELAGLERAPTPSMQLMALARANKAIMAEFKNVLLPELKKKGMKDTYLSADNLVPIFVFVFCRSGMKSPHLYKELLWAMSHPDQLHGECGYYLTVFESAIEYVEVEPIDDIPVEAPSLVSSEIHNLAPKKSLPKLASIGLLQDDKAGESEQDDEIDDASESPFASRFGGVGASSAGGSNLRMMDSLSSLSESGDSRHSTQSDDASKFNRKLSLAEQMKVSIGLTAAPHVSMAKEFTSADEEEK